jgi:hypothetical protein
VVEGGLIVRLSRPGEWPSAVGSSGIPDEPEVPGGVQASRTSRHRAILDRWQPQEWYQPRTAPVGLIDGCAEVDPEITARERAWINRRVHVTGGVSRMCLRRVGSFVYALTTDATSTIEGGGVVVEASPREGLLVRLEIAVPFPTSDVPL